jgi:CHAD domain-containing protein
MGAEQLHRRWRASLSSKLDTTRTLLRKRRPLTEPEVHGLRVALRRARLLAALGTKTLGKTEVKRFRASSRRLLDTLDKVRDCDVTLVWLRGAGASDALATRMQRRRAALWRSAKRHLRSGAAAVLDIVDNQQSGAKSLERRLEKHVSTAQRQCREVVDRRQEIPIEELHRLRRLVRGWRYIVEVQLAPRQIRRDRCLKTLIEVQETLGALQNTEVTIAQLQSLGRTRELNTLCGKLRAQFIHHHSEALQQIKKLPLPR